MEDHVKKPMLNKKVYGEGRRIPTGFEADREESATSNKPNQVRRHPLD